MTIQRNHRLQPTAARAITGPPRLKRKRYALVVSGLALAASALLACGAALAARPR